MNRTYLKEALFNKTGCNYIIEACYKAEQQTGVKWKSVYDFIQGRSIPRIESLRTLQKYLDIDLNKTIL